MKHLYNARDYFKSFFLPHSSSHHSDSLGFISESFVGAGGPLDRGSFSNVLLSVCTYRNEYLRLVLNEDMGCTHGVCGTMKSDIARKFNLPVNRIITQSGKMRQAAPGYVRRKQDVVLDPGQAIAHGMMQGYGTLGGYSVNYQKRTAGSIISNNHVLANLNQARVGDGIFTRGTDTPRHIATLQNYVPILFDGVSNFVDLAIAKIDHDERARDYGPGTNRHAQVGDRVTKIGATTGLTHGVIEALDETVLVTYGHMTAVFEDQMIISGESASTPFSKPGDSGSFIYSADGNFVGLLFAGLGNETNANHASVVMEQLRAWQIVS